MRWNSLSALREVIRDSGLSERELSRVLGKSEGYISSLVHQNRDTSPTVWRLATVCEALGYEIAMRPCDGKGETYILNF